MRVLSVPRVRSLRVLISILKAKTGPEGREAPRARGAPKLLFGEASIGSNQSRWRRPSSLFPLSAVPGSQNGPPRHRLG